MSYINQKICDFECDAFINNEFKQYTHKDLLKHWSILFFYPADFTFVCPTELEDLANLYQDFKSCDCEIYSISTDSKFVHKAWHDTSKRIQKITFPMLSDQTHTLSRYLDVLDDTNMSERASFIINPDGIIVGYEIIHGSVGRNASELLRKLKACKFVYEHGDEVCPARWEDGKETIKPTLDLVGLL